MAKPNAFPAMRFTLGSRGSQLCSSLPTPCLPPVVERTRRKINCAIKQHQIQSSVGNDSLMFPSERSYPKTYIHTEVTSRYSMLVVCYNGIEIHIEDETCTGIFQTSETYVIFTESSTHLCPRSCEHILL